MGLSSEWESSIQCQQTLISVYPFGLLEVEASPDLCRGAPLPFVEIVKSELGIYPRSQVFRVWTKPTGYEWLFLAAKGSHDHRIRAQSRCMKWAGFLSLVPGRLSVIQELEVFPQVLFLYGHFAIRIFLGYHNEIKQASGEKVLEQLISRA